MNGNFRIKHRACFTKKRKSKKLKAHDKHLRNTRPWPPRV